MEWTGARYADFPTVQAELHVNAPPERVWEFVSDPLLMPELSSEVQVVEWLDGATTASLGARFRGRNAHPAIGEWSTTSQVVQYDAPKAFAWAVGDVENPTATWRFTLEADGAGTMLGQWVQLGPGPSGLSGAIERFPDKEQTIVHRRLCEFEQGILGNLDTIKQRAEACA